MNENKQSQNKPFVLKLAVSDEGRLPFFLGGNINTNLLKKLNREANEELKVINKYCKDYVNKCKHLLPSTSKSSAGKTEEENIQQSKYNAFVAKYESLVNSNLQIEAQCAAKRILLEEESGNKNFDVRKVELKNNLAILEKEWIIQKEAVRRNHTQNLFECKFFETYLNCKFTAKSPTDVEVELHPGYNFTLRHTNKNKWLLVEISPKMFSKDKYFRMFEETENLPLCVSSLRKRLEDGWSALQQHRDDTRIIPTDMEC